MKNKKKIIPNLNDEKTQQVIKYYEDDCCTTTRDFWAPDGVVDKKNEEQLLNWMGKHGLPTDPGDIATFLIDTSLADLRVLAVKDLIN